MPDFLRLLGFLKPHWKLVALSVVLGSLTVLSSVGLLAASAYLISAAALHPSIAVLQVAIVGVRFFGLSRGVLRYLERLTTHSVNFRILANLRVWFYREIEPLAPARLLHFQSGDLLARAVADVETLEQFYVRTVAPPMIAIITAAGVWMWIRSYDLTLANVLLAFLIVVGVLIPVVIRELNRRPGMKIIKARAELHAALVDGLQGLSDLLAFGRDRDYLKRIRILDRSLSETQKQTAWIAAGQVGLTTFAVQLGGWVVLLAAILLVQTGRIDGLYLSVLVLGSLAAFEAVLPLPQAAQYLDSSLQAARRLFDLADRTPAVVDPDGSGVNGSAGEPLRFPPSIEIRNLSFRYDENLSPVLTGLDMCIPAGTCTALVGASGAGKTTLLNLIQRFWDYSEGEILLNGIDLRGFPAGWVRQQVSVVSSSTYLFNTTLLQNLLLAKPEASRDEIITAARMAQIHDWIEALPDGYDTWVGERGLRLSGGERQRIAVARAFLKGAPILLLDEPTAHIDPAAECQIYQALADLRRRRTTLLITHRLTHLHTVDEIVVMKEGKIVERGTHADLLQLDGMYARMWQLQGRTIDPV